MDRPRITARILLAVAAAVMLSTASCTYFTPTTTANVAPFADQTMAMSQEVDTSLSGGRLIYARHLATGPKATEYRELLLELQGVVKGIVAYSFQAVTVAESGLPDTTKAAEMAKFLDGLVDRVGEHPHARFSLSAANLDTIIAHVRAAENLVGALRAAQPLADDAGHAAMGIIDDLQEAMAGAEEELVQNVKTKHGGMLRYADSFKRQQSYVLNGLTLVDEYWKGDVEALAALRDSIPLFFKDMPPTSQMTGTHVAEVEERLFARLQRMDEVRQSLAWDVDMYFRQMKEIDEIVASGEKSLRIARVAIHLWVKTHRRLSSGITKPAMIDMFEITKSLVGSVL